MADRQGFVTAAATAGDKEATFPSLAEHLASFDDALAAEPAPESPQLRLLREIGAA